MLYCNYDILNVFQALLRPSSGARDYMCAITANGMQCLFAGCRRSGTGQQAVRHGRKACCPAPDPDNQQPSTAYHRR